MAAQRYPFFLSSKLGRRTLLLFLICAVVPMVVLSMQSRQQVDTLYQEQRDQELRQSAKGIGLLLYERIQYVERQANQIVETIINLDDYSIDAYLSAQQSLLMNNIELSTVELLALNKSQKQILATKPQPLLTFVGDQQKSELLIIYPIKITGVDKLLSFTISQDYFWQYLDEYDLSKTFEVFNKQNILVFSSRDLPSTVNNQLVDSTNYWHLFLDDRYSAGNWRIDATVYDSNSIEDREEFQHLTLMTTLLAVFMASLISVYTIRRSTAPIEALSEGIEQLNNNNFNHQVQIKSNDEFELLGNTFNSMASKLGQHISAIRSLSAIDQLILNHLKIEDIIDVVLTEGGKLLKTENIYFLIKKEDNTFSLFSSVSKKKNNIELNLQKIAMLHKPASELHWHDINLFDEEILIKNLKASYYSSVLGPLDDCKAILIAEFKHDPNEDLLNLASLFVDHVTVALTNADWEGRLFQQSHYDSLTGLPNRYFFNEQLKNSVEQAKNTGQNLALFYIGIDDFKVINDTLGHSVGDKLLTSLAVNLGKTIDSKGKLCRLSGDEFVLIFFSDQKNRSHMVNQTGKIADNLRITAKETMIIDDNEIRTTVSIGISLFPFDCKSEQELLTFAGEAMYRAKSEGKNCFNFYSDISSSSTINRVQFIADLRRALVENEFELYYQPKVHLKTAKIDGCEALIRWNHPQKGLLSPFFFIPQAEEFGMIGEIGLWVVRDAARQQKSWLDRGFDFGQIAVNVSVLQLKEADFHDDFLNILEETGCPADKLEIEITETAYVGDMDNFRGHLDSLAEKGVTFSVDDYGTGYSSLSLLLNLPIKTLKIDKSFIDDIETSKLSYAIVESTILLANSVGLKVVAEGVEEYGQLEILKEFNCSNVQGYYFSKPVTIRKLEAMTSDNYFMDALSPDNI